MKIKNKNTEFTALFAAFMFAQLLILRMGNQAGRGYIPVQRQELVYLFMQIDVILGFLIHVTAFSFLRTGRAYKLLTAFAVAACALGALIMLFCPIASMFYLIITGVSVFFLGFVGGSVYTRMSELTMDKTRFGLCIGVGYSLAVVLQYFLQLRWTVIPALAALSVIVFAALAFLLLKNDTTGYTPPERDDKYISRRTLICGVVIASALLVFINYYNSYIHHLQVASGYTDYNVYTWPRLLMIPTVLVFGIIGDIKGGRLLPISALCVVAVSLLNAVLLGEDTYFLNMCLYYVSLTAAIAYYNITFLRLAARTKRPALWACAGRILDSVIVMLSFAVGLSALSQTMVLVIDIAALIVVIVMMAISGAFNISSGTSTEPPAEPSDADPFLGVRERYGVTPSELKVMRELVLTDDKQEVIAARLGISVSTLRHHVTAIYKKTGTQTRSALCKLIINK